jgi:glycosyltransferase involved in cell wall biosynthesis
MLMKRIDRKDLRAPARVLDLELTPPVDAQEEIVAVEQYNTVWCLSRINGIPQEISFWDVAGDSAISLGTLRDRLRTEWPVNQPEIQGPSSEAKDSATLTVVIPTRDRPESLRAALTGLRGQSDSQFGVVVVDNAPGSKEAATVVETLALPSWEYVVEPRPGASHARNRGLSVVSAELVAWIDDDEIPDVDWVRRLKQGFEHEAAPGAVCGRMYPAELESEAQVRFEQYGGFNKGRGMAPEVLRAGAASVVSPLYPLPPFGAGGNMAFRTELLRSIGGFDTCLRTGEETRALTLVLLAGDAILHWPSAITWHTHRREMAALVRQIYGFSAGTSAFYASMIRSRPTIAFELLRLAPYALRDIRRGSDSLRSGHLPDDFPADLLKAARRGLIEGGFIYAYEAIRNRRQSADATPGRQPPPRRF